MFQSFNFQNEIIAGHRQGRQRLHLDGGAEEPRQHVDGEDRGPDGQTRHGRGRQDHTF